MKTFQLEGKSREVAATSADQKRALKDMRKSISFHHHKRQCS